jgi:hypothetical protein
MPAFDDGLWSRLVEEHDAHLVALTTAPKQIDKRPLLLGGGVAVLAAVTVAAAVGINAATSAPPAYALTQNSDGSVTVTINELATAIPELNARFAEMGIDETVVPVEANCHTRNSMLFAYPQETTNGTLTFDGGRKHLLPGYTGVVAAEQLPNGEMAMAVGAVKPPVPTCVSNVVYSATKGANGTVTVAPAPVSQTTPGNTGS